MTNETNDAAPVKRLKKSPSDLVPAQVTLSAPFGYYDDAGELQYWQSGFTETAAEKIADLIARAAPLEDSK